MFAATEHDFGKVTSGEKKTCSFDFINDGGQDLVIEKIRASCGCTTTQLENTTIQPGQASEITVTYRAGSSGKSKKRVMVYTNDPQTPQTTLWVSAEVPKPKTASQRSVTKTTTTKTKRPAKDTMPAGLKQSLRNLNKATGG
ncbi:MAG: DUF1573 domain-containing protein [Planctomycetota bacterium]